MYVELRKNGTFYLKSSVYNPETKQPKNTSVYLGSNPMQAKDRLNKLTDDPLLLKQIPDMEPYEFELIQVLDMLKKNNHFNTQGVDGLVGEALQVFTAAQQFLNRAKAGVLALAADCQTCAFKDADYCKHFSLKFTMGSGRYKNGRPVRCPAYEEGQNKSLKGSLKLPCDFR